MEREINRREAMVVGTSLVIALGATTQWIAGEVVDALELTDLDMRLQALNTCDWPGFQRDKISLTQDMITVGDIQFAFYDEASTVSWYDVPTVLSSVDIDTIFSIIAGNSKQKAYFFREVLGMKNAEYWLSDIMWWGEKQAIIHISDDNVHLSVLWDGWGDRKNQWQVRRKII